VTARLPSLGDRSPSSRILRGFLGRALLTLFAVMLLSAFLLPLLFMVSTSLQQGGQRSIPGAPAYPAVPEQGTYQGQTYPVYTVPINGVNRDLLLVVKGREESTFVDPADPTQTPIVWAGRWRTLSQPWSFAPQWNNYTTVWDKLNFPRILFNTVVIALLSTVGAVLSSALVAYGFARFRFPLRDALFGLCLATLMLPPEVTIIPLFVIFKNLGWIDTLLPLIVPSLFGGGAFTVFLLRQFILGLPFDLDEAATIDGASKVRILFDIIVPNAKPALAAAAVFSFINHWNEFFQAVIFLNSKKNFTIPLGLYSLRTYAGDPGEPKDQLLMAGSVIATLPST
jgi:multiple sugar transport system permease protein